MFEVAHLGRNLIAVLLRTCSADHFVFSLQKLLQLQPTTEEKTRIQEAHMSNPDVALGNAEQFLLTMSSINELAPRLHLWSFKLDYDQLERVRKNFGL